MGSFQFVDDFRPGMEDDILPDGQRRGGEQHFGADFLQGGPLHPLRQGLLEPDAAARNVPAPAVINVVAPGQQKPPLRIPDRRNQSSSQKSRKPDISKLAGFKQHDSVQPFAVPDEKLHPL